MGEMADFLIEQTQNAYPDWNPFGRPMCRAKRRMTCRFCGKTGLEWGARQTGGKWPLIEPNGVVHVCTPEDLAKDFDKG